MDDSYILCSAMCSGCNGRVTATYYVLLCEAFVMEG